MFSAGDRVRARLANPVGHTRLPAYLRGRVGCIAADLGTFPFADARARGEMGAPEQRLYSVRFEARDVFGADAQDDSAIYADLYESYLERMS